MIILHIVAVSETYVQRVAKYNLTDVFETLKKL